MIMSISLLVGIEHIILITVTQPIELDSLNNKVLCEFNP